MTNMLSIDQAYTLSGYAIWKDDQLVEAAQKKFSSLGEQLTFFSALLVEHEIDLVVMEDIYSHANVQTFKQLARVQGALMGYLEMKEIPYEIYLAVEWRSRLNMRPKNRVEAKRMAVALCKERYPSMKFTQDMAEGTLIGLAHLTPKQSAF